MKKVMIIVVAAVLLVGAGVAFATGVFDKQPEPTKGAYSSDFVTQYIQETKKDGSVLYREQDLLFDNEGCFTLGADAGYSSGFSFRTNVMERIVTIFPNPIVKEFNDYYYLYYDTDNNSRLFMFFSKEKNKGMFTDGFPVLMEKNLSYEDFSKLKIGDNLLKVEKIDPIITLYTRVFEEATDDALKVCEDEGIYLTSVHLLTDGILKIEYERTEDADYVITNIVYSEDFVLEGLNGKTCYKISEMDYVK